MNMNLLKLGIATAALTVAAAFPFKTVSAETNGIILTNGIVITNGLETKHTLLSILASKPLVREYHKN